jgi:hypothetical protein
MRMAKHGTPGQAGGREAGVSWHHTAAAQAPLTCGPNEITTFV